MKKQLIITLEGPQGIGKSIFANKIHDMILAIRREPYTNRKIVVFNDRDIDLRTADADIVIQTKQAL